MDVPTTTSPDEPAPSPQELVESCQGLVRSIAWKIYKRLPAWVDFDDLVADGNLGLALAARDYNPAHGTQFTTYAYHRVRGAVFDGLAKTGWFTPRAYHASEYEHGSQAPAEASADETVGTSDEYSAPHLETETGAPVTNDGDALADEATPAPLTVAMARELHHTLRKLIETLPAAPRALILARYFEDVTLQEAARRLGISKPWATRLHTRALGRLARALRGAGTVG
jgi:RNA polymerase sigma factor for flagellar operon FliA